VPVGPVGVVTLVDSILVTVVDDGLNLLEFMFSENNNAPPTDSPQIEFIPSIFQHRPMRIRISTHSVWSSANSCRQWFCPLTNPFVIVIAALSVSVPDYLLSNESTLGRPTAVVQPSTGERAE